MVRGDFEAEKEAIIWQACPYKYPKGEYIPKKLETERKELNGFTFNIDPEGCRDIDDVLTFEKLEEGWKVTITISDVAAYVESDSIVDIFASLMGQTLYENGQPVRPMLPQQFSDECSLFPGKISYGISLQFQWNERTNERNEKITNN
jgi:exoribonuclease R